MLEIGTGQMGPAVFAKGTGKMGPAVLEIGS